VFVCLLGRSTPPEGDNKKNEVRQKKKLVKMLCHELGVFWWFFERMGGLKNHYRWLTSVCSSFGYFFFFSCSDVENPC